VSVLITIGLIVFLGLRAKQKQSDASTRDAIQALLFAAVFQGAIGYAQYFTGVPVVLVAVHIAGATALWFAVCNLCVSPSREI
jgi:cytochrome c oxidase assembly protein subunit 15